MAYRSCPRRTYEQPVKKPKTARPKPGPAPAKPVKPPAWHPVSVAQQRQQHRAAVKAAAARKKPPAPAKKTQPKKTVRKLALGQAVACCSAQALGTLLGWGWEDVLALYWRTCQDPDEGASVLDTLRAARLSGADFRHGPEEDAVDEHAVETDGHVRQVEEPLPCLIGDDWPDGQRLDSGTLGHGLILGVTLPEPHAIAITPDGTWWSWGEPFNPAEWPDLVIEEAWTVRWGT